jgi:DNA primase
VWPDNDEAGLEYARKASEAIANAGASSVAVLHIPDGKPDKWDIHKLSAFRGYHGNPTFQ